MVPSECPTCGVNMALHDCYCDDVDPRSLTLTIPGTPAYSLSPNSRSHWRVKHRETNDLALATKAAIGYIYRHFPGPVRLRWTIYLAKRGKPRDLDNLLPCLKPAQDQIVRADIIPDDSPTYIPHTPTIEQVRWSDHKSEPRIVVTITEIGQEATV